MDHSVAKCRFVTKRRCRCNFRDRDVRLMSRRRASVNARRLDTARTMRRERRKERVQLTFADVGRARVCCDDGCFLILDRRLRKSDSTSSGFARKISRVLCAIESLSLQKTCRPWALSAMSFLARRARPDDPPVGPAHVLRFLPP